MTFKAKIGDRVRLVRVPYDNIKIGHEDTVTRVDHSGTKFDVESNLDKGKGFMNHVNYWELVSTDPKEEAIKLLTEAGYVVTPPPPPLAGEVVVYSSINDLVTRVVMGNHWDKHTSAQGHRILARIPWTEGMGLEDKPKDGSF